MRTIKEFTFYGQVKCTIFSWNGKYLVKLENGSSEQTYKISELEITSQEELDLWLGSPGFKDKVKLIFQTMEENLDGLFV